MCGEHLSITCSLPSPGLWTTQMLRLEHRKSSSRRCNKQHIWRGEDFAVKVPRLAVKVPRLFIFGLCFFDKLATTRFDLSFNSFVWCQLRPSWGKSMMILHMSKGCSRGITWFVYSSFLVISNDITPYQDLWLELENLSWWKMAP